jgi:hypothetical protein
MIRDMNGVDVIQFSSGFCVSCLNFFFFLGLVWVSLNFEIMKCDPDRSILLDFMKSTVYSCCRDRLIGCYLMPRCSSGSV